jgi:hypothetical protein
MTISIAHPAKGRGIANIYDSKFQFTGGKKMTASLTFEVLVMKSMQTSQLLFIATVYRPPVPYTAFLTEFPEFLSDLVVIIVHRHYKRLSEPSTQWVLCNMSRDLRNVTIIPWI